VAVEEEVESTEIPDASDERDEWDELILDEVPTEEIEQSPAPDSSVVGEGTPTPGPEDDSANASGKTVRNILLGGLGVLALGAGIFLILLGKKKEEEEEA